MTRWTHAPVGRVVVETVAGITGRSQLSLPPLGEVVDPERLDGLFPSADADGVVVFGYCGYTVCVRADRRVTVHESG